MKTLSLALTITLVLSASSAIEASDLSQAYSRMVRTDGQEFTSASTPQPAASTNRLLLGAYVQDVDGGLQVTGTVSGSPASEVLQPGDILRQLSAEDQPTRRLATQIQMEHAKRNIGANRPAALEILRPGSGLQYLWVTFQPAGELAEFQLDSPQADARSMFDRRADMHVSR